jgi:putative transcriptional regulator
VEFFEAPAFTRHLGAHLDDGDDRMARNTVKKRDLFGELMEGVSAMQAQREGRITLRSHQVERLSLPRIDQQIIRSTRERLHMSRPAFAYRIGVNPRTLERWEQGRSKPNDQAAALILLVRKYPGTLKRLQQLAVAV